MNKLYLGIGIAVILAIVFYMRSRRARFGSAGSGASLQGFQNPSGTTSTFTMYYADWCPHCQAVKPDFEKMVKGGEVSVGGKKCKIQMVNSEKDPDVVKSKNVKGFPTFILETPEGEMFEYSGDRSTAGYLAFINEKLGGGI
jgi:protein disulfide-isomerase